MMEITIQAAQSILKKIPMIGDKVISISSTEIIYSANRKISSPYNVPNNNLKIGDIVTSVHINLEVNEKVVRINVDHNKGGIFACGLASLQANIRDIKIEQILK
jgi:hypothetical protein